MNVNLELVCVGDLMLESILRVPALPQPKQTLVVDGKPFEVGGTAFNLCWYFAQWGWRPKLVSVFGERQRSIIEGALAASGLVAAGLLPVAGENDLLLVWLNDRESTAVYLRSRLPDDLESALAAQCSKAQRLILSGSRHARLRQLSIKLAQDFQGDLLAFSPSYSIYEYQRDELEGLFNKAHFIALNEHEVARACRVLNVATTADLAKSLPGCLVVTLAHQGVCVYDHGEVHTLKSFSNSAEDVIGAGDAFFAAFLQVIFRNGSILDGARFGSLAAAEQVNAGQVRARIAIPLLEERMLREFSVKAREL